MAIAERHALSADTQTILLLCGRFDRQEEMAPLKTAEYNRLVEWLVQQHMRPADLLHEGWLDRARQNLFPLDMEQVSTLLRRGAALAFAVERWTSKGLWVLSRSDKEYPQLLKNRFSRWTPPILYGAGPLQLAERGGLAIVGSRAADEAALAFTREVAIACARQGIPVISGGARGVDSEAMAATLDAGGTAIGMLADSLSKHVVSGRYRRALLDGQLALLSAVAPDSGFNAGNAMARNKYIYGLATWGLVVSASLGEGGTWTGAVEELDARRVPVFVRVTEPSTPAQRKLVELGARPFPNGDWDDLVRSLDEDAEKAPHQAALPVEQAAQSPQSTALPGERVAREADEQPVASLSPDISVQQPVAARRSAYDAILPLLLSCLAEPRDIESIAAELEVQKGQIQAWLARAAHEGAVQKLQRPVRYTVARQPMLPLDASARTR